MYPTAEARWFYPGPVPAAVETWFHQRAGSVESQPPRKDHYLYLPSNENLNIKLREGLIEIKQRVGKVSVTPLHEQVTGLVESWRKWSFELAEPSNAASRAIAPASSWIAVEKRRQLRIYGVQEDDDVIALPESASPAEGCELEMTAVDAMGQTWWTLAFEAFGEEAALRDHLLLVAQHLFSADEPPSLQATHSLGYAAWLTNLAQSQGGE